MQAEKTIPEEIIPSYIRSADVNQFLLEPGKFIVKITLTDTNDLPITVFADMTTEWENWAQLKKDEWNSTFRKIVAEGLNIPVEDVTGDLWI